MRMRLCSTLLAILLVPTFPVNAQRTEPIAAGTRNANLEDAVAAVFEQARSEAGLPPLSRVRRSDVEKLVCTASVLGTSGERPGGLHLNKLYKTTEPGKIGDDLREFVARRDRVGFRHFAVAVWAAQPHTVPVQYWVGFRLYRSSGAAFFEDHFTDQAFYRNTWKEAVVPQCKGASAN